MDRDAALDELVCLLADLAADDLLREAAEQAALEEARTVDAD